MTTSPGDFKVIGQDVSLVGDASVGERRFVDLISALVLRQCGVGELLELEGAVHGVSCLREAAFRKQILSYI